MKVMEESKRRDQGVTEEGAQGPGQVVGTRGVAVTGAGGGDGVE